MAVNNKLFQFAGGQVFDTRTTRRTCNREELLSEEIAEDLNTYKNFGIFHTRADVVVPKTDKDGNEIPAEYAGAARAGAIGVRSIFNAYSAAIAGEDGNYRPSDAPNSEAQFEGKPITTQEGMSKAWSLLVARQSDWRHSANSPLVDTPATRRLLRQHNDISVKGLVEASKHGALSRAPYAYSDFMYCKHLNRVPNNYLITLRRYANPVEDNVRPTGRGRKKAEFNRSGLAHPIGTMVTWMGVSGNSMESILKYSYSMAFEEKTAQWEQVTKEGGEGLLNGLEAALNPSTRSMWQQGYANNPLDSLIPGMMGGAGGGGPYSYPPPRDSNKVYGPIDRVKKNYRRSGDGLNWDMKFTLTFEYELRAYNGINPRQAMTDLIASILSITYTSGGFWPGGYYGGGMGQSSTFRNLSIFKATGGFTNYMDALVHDISTIGAKVQQEVASNGGWLETAKKVLNMIGGLLMGALINKLGRPAKYHAPSLLSEAPCGLWHITIGNPYRPIISMGNMILLKTEISHSGPLGLDDFPTNLTVKCDFDRGKPRDQYGVEAIYMNGNDRVYNGMSDKILDMYKAADVYKKGGTNTQFALDRDPVGTRVYVPPKDDKKADNKGVGGKDKQQEGSSDQKNANNSGGSGGSSGGSGGSSSKGGSSGGGGGSKGKGSFDWESATYTKRGNSDQCLYAANQKKKEYNANGSRKKTTYEWNETIKDKNGNTTTVACSFSTDSQADCLYGKEYNATVEKAIKKAKKKNKGSSSSSSSSKGGKGGSSSSGGKSGGGGGGNSGAQQQAGNDGQNNNSNADAQQSAGSNAGQQAPQGVNPEDIPGHSLEELNKRAVMERIAAEELAVKMKDMQIIKETFGDPDAYVLVYTSKEQQEGSAKRMEQEVPGKSNTNENQEQQSNDEDKKGDKKDDKDKDNKDKDKKDGDKKDDKKPDKKGSRKK